MGDLFIQSSPILSVVSLKLVVITVYAVDTSFAVRNRRGCE
jgi:hypothetical protein